MPHHSVPIAALAPLGLLLAGAVLIWFAARRTNRQRRLTTVQSSPLPQRAEGAVDVIPAAVPITSRVLRAAGVTLLLAGLLAEVVVGTQFLATFAIPAVILVVALVVRKYYQAEQQALLWVLLTAADRGIPLDNAARSFAGECTDPLGQRAVKLADFLEAGLPLGLALQRAGHRIDHATALAADLGTRTGTLGPALRQVIDRGNVIESVAIPCASRLVYVGLIVLYALLVLPFTVLKILPALEMMYRDFGTSLPPATQYLAAVGEWGTGEWFFGLFVVVVGLLGLLVGVLWFFGFSLRHVPLLRRLWWRTDCALVLQWLAIGVRQGRPLVETLRLLAGYFPQRSMRKALERAAHQVGQGGNWCDGLQRGRMIRRIDSAVLKAAERAGNLPWTLDQLADRSVHRWSCQLQAGMNLAFPLIVVALGAGVLVIVLGSFLPLVTLIRGLA